MTDDVSRETPSVGPPTEAARRVFAGEALELAERYAGSLATDGVLRGLIGPREVPRLWDRHLANCALLAPLLPRDADVVDIGSGAGLPGVVLAIVRPDLSMTLLEPLLRRTTYLEQVVAELGLTNVEIVRGRAESLHGQRTFDVVTSRAVAPLPRLLEWSMPLVAAHGQLLALKGSRVHEEIREAEPTLTRWGCAPPEVNLLGGEQGTAVAGVASSDDATDATDATGGSTTSGGGSPTYALRVSWVDPGSVRSLPTSSSSTSAGAGTGSEKRGRSTAGEGRRAEQRRYGDKSRGGSKGQDGGRNQRRRKRQGGADRDGGPRG